MVRIIAIFAAQDNRSGQLRMPELPVRALSARYEREAGTLQVRYELSYFSRHKANFGYEKPHTIVNSL